MTTLSLRQADQIMDTAFHEAASRGLKPLAVAVLDAGGHLKAFRAQDGTSILRPQIAHGKAYGAIGLGIGSRAIFKRAEEQPFFVNAVNAAANGALIPVPGGVLIKDDNGTILGAVGVTGDTSDNDEACAVAGIEGAGLKADCG